MCKNSRRRNWLHVIELQTLLPLRSPRSLRLMRNKANLYFTAENAEFAEQKGICVNGCPIKKYNLHLTSLRSLRTQRLMRNKANFKVETTTKGVEQKPEAGR